MKPRIYLDTSVISLATDDRSPERRDLTLSFFAAAGHFTLCTSEVARQEIMETPNEERRLAMLPWIERLEISPLTDDMISLAGKLIEGGIFTRRMEDDARHVAAAVLSDVQVLVSWNFQHLVNRRCRALINNLLTQLGFRMVEILSPPEV